MSLIECPECGKEISDKANSCPNCGYPLNNNQSYESDKYSEVLSEISKGNKIAAIKIYREIAGVSLAEAKNEVKKLTIASNGSNPKCPTCGSPNIQKISLGNKAVGGAMFGIFSNNVRKTFICKDCNYKW